MNHQVAAALEAVEQWHQASIRAGAATRLLMAVSKVEGISEPALSRMLEIDCRKLQWLARRGIGPTKRIKTSELIEQ